MEDGQVVAPDFVFRAVDVLGQADVRHVARAAGSAGQLHARVLQYLVALARVAAAAAGDEVVPLHSPTRPFGQDVVNGQVSGLDAAILAGVIVAGKDRAARQLEFRQGPLDMVAQAQHGRGGDGVALARQKARRILSVMCVQDVRLA